MPITLTITEEDVAQAIVHGRLSLGWVLSHLAQQHDGIDPDAAVARYAAELASVTRPSARRLLLAIADIVRARTDTPVPATTLPIAMAGRNWRTGPACGEVFDEDVDYDGDTVTIELRTTEETDAVAQALADQRARS